jgi:hypothetical protein
MRRLKMEVVTAVVAWALASTCHNLPVARSLLHGLCPRGDADGLGNNLSSTAKIYFPGSTEFNAATARWSVLDEPTVNVVVVPGTENDVVETVGVLSLVFSFVCPAFSTMMRLYG